MTFPLKIVFKKIVCVFLLFTYSTVAFNFFAPLLGYYLFFDYITKELCVQKNKKENLCMGKCHLKKQIKQETQTEEKTDQKGVLLKTESQSPHYVSNLFVKPISAKLSINFEHIQLNLKTNYSKPLTPPPKIFI